MIREERRGPWYLLTGLAIGVVLGLFYAWVINPVEFVDTTPETLLPEFKDQYRSLVALAFQASGDLGRAHQRLALLQDSAPVAELGGQVLRLRSDSPDSPEAAALEILAQALQQPAAAAAQTEAATTATAPALLDPTATLSSAEVIRTPTPLPPTPKPTFTQRPTLTSQANLGAPFELQDRQLVCDEDKSPGLLQVEVLDAGGKPLSGVRITVTWDGGEESFFTGLKPGISAGYADFQMENGQTYAVQAGSGGKPAEDVRAESCSGSSAGSPGGVKLVFSQQ